MPTLHLTADAVQAGLSIALSLFFAYFPGVSTWYDGLKSETKPLIQLGIIAAGVLAYAFAGCNFIPACLIANWPEIGGVFLACLTANNMTYQHLVRQFKNSPPAAPPAAPANSERP